MFTNIYVLFIDFHLKVVFFGIIIQVYSFILSDIRNERKKFMRSKKRFIFLPIIMLASFLLGACNDTPVEPNPPTPPGPVETTYTVSFISNGGSGMMLSVNVAEGEYVLPECDFTAPSGKFFAGWKVNGEGSAIQPGAKITISSNTRLVAQWSVTTYTVSFDANGGTGDMSPVSDKLGDYILPECGFTAPEGKHFTGWKVNNEGYLLQPGAKIDVASNITIVAQWATTTYTVSFDANSGTGTMNPSKDQVGEYVLPECGFTAPEGKHFIGWKVNGEGNTLEPGAKINVGSNVKLVAQWVVTTYTVSFASNGGSGSMTAVDNQVGEYTLPACDFTAPSGEHFIGWRINNEGGLLQVGSTIDVRSNVSLYAQWAETTYTVSFASNGGTGSMANVLDQLGEYTLPDCKFVAPEGDHFDGWKVNGQGETLKAGTNIIISADTQLVAQWAVTKYTVSFASNGGKGTMADIPEQLGEFTLPESTYEIPQVGQHFAGWKVNGEGDALQAGEKINITADTQLVAQWAANQYSVEFRVNGQTIQTTQVSHGEKAAYSGETPTKAGDANAYKYRFKGWDKKPEDTIITGNTVFEAQFQPYAEKMIIDDFESYDESADMIDAGWITLGYNNTSKQWTTETAATVSLCNKSEEGNKSLRFNAWENDVGYKFAISFTEGQFDKSANALRFRMMAPSMNQVKLILYANAVINGESMNIKFLYTFRPNSSEFVEYTIPFASEKWLAWDDPTLGTLPSLAAAAGICEDDIVNYITNFEFFLKGYDGSGQKYAAYLDSMSFVTIDNLGTDQIEVEGLEAYTKYTGLTTGGYTTKVTIGEGYVTTIETLDEETPHVINGVSAIDVDKKTVTFTSDDDGESLVYTGKFTDAGQIINCTSVTGSLAEFFGEISFNAVRTVEDFEQYTKDGVAWFKGDDEHPGNEDHPEERSGARGAYYSEYYSGDPGDSAPFGKGGWSLLRGAGDQLKLMSDNQGHNGSKNYLCLKNSKGNALRYMQWGLFDGTAEDNSFRGSTLSFWAKTNGRVPALKVSMYSQPNPTLSTKDTSVRAVTFEEEDSIDGWTHFEVALNPKVVYYGFMVFMEKNYLKESFLYIDDIEIYTASPYKTYVAPVTSLSIPNHLQFVGKKFNLINTSVEFIDNEHVSLKCPGLGIDVDGTYSTTLDEVSMVFDDVTYKATINETLESLTYKSVTGNNALASLLNGLSFDVVDYADNCESYNCNGTMYYQSNTRENLASGARKAYFCDYKPASMPEDVEDYISPIGGEDWLLMGGAGDQLSLDKTTSADGEKSLSIKSSTAGDMRYMQWDLYKGVLTSHKGYNKFVISIKNPNPVEVTIKIQVFKSQQVTSSTVNNVEEREIVIPANQDWTEYFVELDANANYYGYGIYLPKRSGESCFINIDKAYYCYDYNFYAVKNQILAGTITPGAASLRFGNPGVIYFTCESLSLSNVKGSYTMQMDGVNQVMTVTVSGTTITGIYAVDASGTVTFTVTAVEGTHAANIPLNTVFTYTQS